MHDLHAAARRCLEATDPAEKVRLSFETWAALREGSLAPDPMSPPPLPIGPPGRPERPRLVPSRELAQRGLGTSEGRAALVHAIAHIEFNAIDLAWDAEFLSRLIAGRKPELLICDMRDGLGKKELEALARNVSITAVIDDGSERRLAADVAYYPPVPQAAVLDWTGSDCVARIGWEWALLGLTKAKLNVRPRAARPSLLVTMGGSDPFGLTLRAARALAKLDPVFRARFVIGPGMEHAAQTAKRIASLAPHFETIENADDLTTEIAASDLALTAFGVTAYELAAYGVPALYLCLNEDHALSASAFERAGMGMSLGVHSAIEDFDIASATWALIGDSARRRDMHAAGLMAIDGEGAVRIAADLAASLKQRRSATPSRIAI